MGSGSVTPGSNQFTRSQPRRLTEGRPRRAEPIVERHAPHAARGDRLLARPVHLVETSERLDRAHVHPGPLVGPAAHPRDVHVGEIHRGVPLHDPLGGGATRARARR